MKNSLLGSDGDKDDSPESRDGTTGSLKGKGFFQGIAENHFRFILGFSGLQVAGSCAF